MILWLIKYSPISWIGRLYILCSWNFIDVHVFYIKNRVPALDQLRQIDLAICWNIWCKYHLRQQKGVLYAFIAIYQLLLTILRFTCSYRSNDTQNPRCVPNFNICVFLMGWLKWHHGCCIKRDRILEKYSASLVNYEPFAISCGEYRFLQVLKVSLLSAGYRKLRNVVIAKGRNLQKCLDRVNDFLKDILKSATWDNQC